VWAVLSVLFSASFVADGPSPRAEAAVTVPPRPAGADPWLATINWWRSFGAAVDGSAFPSVTQPNPRHLGPQHHVDYLMSLRSQGSTYCGHGEDPMFPKPQPDDYYWHNVLFCGPESLRAAVDGWMITPYHGPPLLAPEVTSVDAGGASNGGTDTAYAAVTAGTTPISEPYVWPAPDGVLPSAEMTTGEIPEPRAFCPPIAGENPGQPVYLWTPSSRRLVSATVGDGAGAMPFCILGSPFGDPIVDPGEQASQFTVFTKRPWVVGEKATVSITTEAFGGGDQQTVTWSFDVVDIPESDIALVTSGNGSAIVGLQPGLATDALGGLPVQSMRLRLWPVSVTQPWDSPPVVDKTFAGSGGSTAVPPGRYRHCVTVTNAVGTSRCAIYRSIVILTAPSPPTDVSATAGRRRATVTWGFPTDTGGTFPSGFTVTASPGGATIHTTNTLGATFTDLTPGVSYTFAVVAHNSVGTSAATVSAPVVPLAAPFAPLSPMRLLDTRSGDGAATIDGQFLSIGKRGAGTETELLVAGRPGIPGDVSAVVLNVTVTEPDADGFVTVYPCGTQRPNASNVNYTAGATIPNAVTVKVGAAGKVCLYTLATTHLVVDINGYEPGDSAFGPLSPARVLDTRSGDGIATTDDRYIGIGKRAGGTVTELEVAGRGGVPAGADAVVLNVTVTEPEADGFVTVFPCGAARPNASSLNFTAGLTIANAVTARIGAGGAICLYTLATTHLVVDVGGFHLPTPSFGSLPPARLLETRGGPDMGTIDGQQLAVGRRPARSVTPVQVIGRGEVPAGATAVVLNVTVTEPDASGYVTVFPCGAGRPNASNLNYAAGQTIANAVTARVGQDGTVCLYTLSSTELVVDVTGFYRSA
jgi:hypothetical protein